MQSLIIAQLSTESEKSSQTTKKRNTTICVYGYYLEEELILRDSSYATYYDHVPGYGLLKNEYEDEPDLKQKKRK